MLFINEFDAIPTYEIDSAYIKRVEASKSEIISATHVNCVWVINRADKCVYKNEQYFLRNFARQLRTELRSFARFNFFSSWVCTYIYASRSFIESGQSFGSVCRRSAAAVKFSLALKS